MHEERVPPDEEPLGATGKFPMGHLNYSDEGELRFGVAADKRNGKILVEFGKPVAWIALDPHLARELARTLMEKAGDVTSNTLH